MKKIVRQQNYLKELIETQDNPFMTRMALKCLIRSAVEPLLDNPESGVVFHRINTISGLNGLFKRLEFSDIESFDFTDTSDNLVEKVWANTEFLFVMTQRYVSIIIWDNHTGDEELVRYYSLYNSKLQNEPLDILKRNSKIDITPYQEKFTPDRRDNLLLNASIRKLIENIDTSVGDAVLGYAEKTAEKLSDNDYIQQKSRMIAHELKNQLSICDLYTEIMKKKIEQETLNADSVLNSINAINKALKMANNSLISLRTSENSQVNESSIKEIIEEAVELSQVYLLGKSISLKVDIHKDINIVCDKDKLMAMIINLVKNSSEAFMNEDLDNTNDGDKFVEIKTDEDENFGLICVSNNAKGIEEPEKIFNSGFSTKSTGHGLGLWICKKYAQEQGGDIELTRSSEDFTEFTIKITKIAR